MKISHKELEKIIKDEIEHLASQGKIKNKNNKITNKNLGEIVAQSVEDSLNNTFRGNYRRLERVRKIIDEETSGFLHEIGAGPEEDYT